ncbi:MAG TPA: tryptophan--tRNA ligase [Candidatus Saccharimonadales bacterium]|nr:tryptophan--tRNA ligase [Candidatus Saccharimonadales bacterium]
MTKQTILTGLRANNDLTIGNYFGAMLPMVDMAKQKAGEYQINMFIPDLHSFTTPINHDELQEQVMNNARLYVAAGLPIDHDDIYLYRQSYISAHSELTWILDCFTGVGEMNRMTEFKDKMAKIGDERVSVGLFNYPVLMAADILLYDAELVPVGDDQRQHLEFARDIAERINNRFGDIFTIPKTVRQQHEFFGKDQGLRIKDLQNPTKKMSKSDETGKGVIFLGDDPEAAAKKIMSATTDDLGEIHFDRDNQPGISNLLEILTLLRGSDLQQTIGEFEGQTRYGDFKKVVADELKAFLTGFQTRLRDTDDQEIIRKLEASEQAMAVIANATLLRAQRAVGLRPKEQ